MLKNKTPDIHKIGAVRIKDKKFLVTHEKGKEFYIAPGGVIEDGEVPEDALVRELKEEINIDVKTRDLEFFGSFYAQAAGAKNKLLKMDVYVVKN